MDASLFIQTLQKRQGLMVACPEEIAYRSGYITAAQLEDLARPMRNNGYGPTCCNCCGNACSDS